MKLTFSPKNEIGTANPMIYGHFLEHFHRQVYGGVYDPQSRFADEDGFRADVLEALKRIKTPIIRWPGGCYVSAYDWHAGTGKNRQPVFDKAWRVEESNEFGTDEYVKLCRKIGCEPYICTNAGTGTAEQMSDWLEYCNLKDMGKYAKERIANGNPEPFGVKYWSIGNENYGFWELGAKESDEWARLVRESAKNMIRVDPSVQLSAASIPDLDWNLNLLKAAGQYLDWISIHGYWDFSPDGVTYADYDAVMLFTGDEISGSIDRVRAYLTAFGLQKRVKIAYDEWNLRGWFHPHIHAGVNRAEDEKYYKNEVLAPRNLNDVNATYTMADAIFSASFLNTCLRNCDLVGMACFSPIVNTRGAIYTYEDGIVLRPQYFVFDLYANLMKPHVLNLWKEEVPTLSGQGKTVDLVDAVVTYEGGEYAVAAVNKDRGSMQTVNLRAIDGSMSQIKLYILNGPDPDSYNDVGKTDVGVTETDWQSFDGRLTLPPHSVCVALIR